MLLCFSGSGLEPTYLQSKMKGTNTKVNLLIGSNNCGTESSVDDLVVVEDPMLQRSWIRYPGSEINQRNREPLEVVK